MRARAPMLCIGYAKSVPDEGLRSIDKTVTPHPSRTRFARACHPLPQGERGRKDGRFYFPFTILRQCCHAASIRFSLASGVRNAECADSVTLGSFVRG